jgi:arsenate reductase
VKPRVLFVCIGNAIRSQMAEGFARILGRDIVVPASAGVSPAARLDPLAAEIMDDIGIDISGHFPKHAAAMTRTPFDLIVNISGHELPPGFSAPVIEWEVADPIGLPEEEYRRTRDRIQKLTLRLIDEIRAQAAAANVKPPPKPQLLDHKRRFRKK